MASANISFYLVTGAEIHWKKVHSFHRDAAAIRTLLSGLAGFLFVECFMITVSWFLTPYLYNATGHAVRILGSSLRHVFCCGRRRADPDPEAYGPVPFEDSDDEMNERDDSLFLVDSPNNKPGSKAAPITLVKRLVVLIPTFLLILLELMRPPEPAYAFLSCTLPLSPFFVDGRHQLDPVDLGGLEGDYTTLVGNTALSEPPFFDFLPRKKMDGFEDWNGHSDPNRTRLHYDAAEDPLRISNLEYDVIEPLREALHNGTVNIKHVILVKLESTRGDVFPVRKGTFMYDRIAESHKHRRIPKDVEDKLVNLTRTSRYLTGTATGIDQKEDRRPSYGGLSATNAFTSGTYTLKSAVGTVCGASPLVADFNREYKYHVYQPCIPHVLDVLNQQPDITNKSDDFTTWPWESMWMQSVTDGYDNQRTLTSALGFENVTTKKNITDPKGKHYSPKSKEINYYGYPDTELREYIRDAIKSAEQDQKRLFITHLTGTTHHPWAIPGKKYQDLMGHRRWYSGDGDVNRYLNSIGFVDKWLAEILEMLEEAGIADETLLVMTGDQYVPTPTSHYQYMANQTSGLSLPNDGSVTPYDNPNIGSFQIPIAFSHPQLPQVEIDSPTITTQIVPTLLDLLIESSSLGPDATHAVKNLLPLYEGQSLLRPLIKETDDKQDWQFTVMNTGGTWLAMRSAARPYRLIVPLISDVEWRFTDLEKDPYELKPLLEFSLPGLAEVVERRYDEDVAKWVKDAAHVASWWVKENWKRYEYNPRKD